ncbi:DUF3137 domain-containing protein [Myxococcota bacterium]|nr:DUF3137 domain-containing protein [Myxococcota bacterium]
MTLPAARKSGLESPIPFTHPIFVLPDKAEKHLGLAARALQSLPGRGLGRLLHLEDPIFEQYFMVYGEDEVEARYVLSPNLMRRLVSFRERNDSGVRMAFIGGSVHVAMPFSADLFHFGKFEELDPMVMRSWAFDLAYATGLIEDLDLNTRIWSKESGGATQEPRPSATATPVPPPLPRS